MKVVDATLMQLRAFYGFVPRCRAWAALEGDRVVAVAGYRFEPGRIAVFADFGKGEIRRYPLLMMRTGRKLVAEVSERGMPVHVAADLQVPRSREFLQRLGFKDRT